MFFCLLAFITLFQLSVDFVFVLLCVNKQSEGTYLVRDDFIGVFFRKNVL